MSRRRTAAAALALVSLLSCAPGPEGQSPPNLVIVLVDDLGWGDLGVHGPGVHPTPHLDRMAAEGLRFTDFYVSQPTCSASRASLLTGCYAPRVGISGVLGPDSPRGLSTQETTLAELCQQAGYATALYGKWHLGDAPGFLPTQHGFDAFYGIPYSNNMGPLNPAIPEGWPPLPTLDGTRVVELDGDQERYTATFTDKALGFIEQAVADERPFFVLLSQPMPHIPLHAGPSWRGRSELGLYGDVIQELDASVGQLHATLDRLGVDDQTLVVFFSDNGPWLAYGAHAGSAGPFREGKGTVFEGGVRVPCLLRWPGVIPAGAVCNEPAMSIDLLPTLAHRLGLSFPELPIDGRDVWSLVDGTPDARSPHDADVFWNDDGELQALRSGRWKLHFPHRYDSAADQPPGQDGRPGTTRPRRTKLALFDLRADPGESTNVATANPEVVQRLSLLADDWRERLGDRLRGVQGSEVREPGWVR